MYYVLDAPGHYGDEIRVYRACKTLRAAQRFARGYPMLAIATAPTLATRRKGDRIWRGLEWRLRWVTP